MPNGTYAECAWLVRLDNTELVRISAIVNPALNKARKTWVFVKRLKRMTPAGGGDPAGVI